MGMNNLCGSPLHAGMVAHDTSSSSMGGSPLGVGTVDGRRGGGRMDMGGEKFKQESSESSSASTPYDTPPFMHFYPLA